MFREFKIWIFMLIIIFGFNWSVYYFLNNVQNNFIYKAISLDKKLNNCL